MQDRLKSKEQLIDELVSLRRRMTDLINQTSNHYKTDDMKDDIHEIYYSLVDQANYGIAILQETKIKYINPMFTTLTGYTTQELLNRSFLDFIPSDESQEIVENYKKRMRGDDAPVVYESMIRHKNGKKLYVEFNNSIITYKKNTANLIVIHDICERKQSEKLVKRMIELSQDLILTINRENQILSINPACYAMLGYESKEMIGINFKDFIHPNDVQSIIEILRIIRKEVPVQNFENRFRHKNGSWVFINWSVTSDPDEEDIIYAIGRNVTEHKSIEASLRESEKLMSDFSNSATDAFMHFDDDLRLVMLNGASLKMLNLTEDVIGSHILNFAPHIENTDRYEKYKDVIRTGKTFYIDDIVPGADFGETHMRINAFKTSTGAGVIISDITEIKQATQKLAESEQRYSRIVESGNDGIIIVRESGFIFANKKIADMLGYTVDELLNLNFGDVATDKSLEVAIPRMIARIAGEDIIPTYEIELINRDGSRIPFEINNSKIEYDGEPADLVLLRDVTYRKQAEEELRASEEKYSMVVERANDAIFIIQDGVFKFANTMTLELLKYQLEELIDMDFQRTLSPDSVEIVKENYQKRMNGEIAPNFYEVSVLDKEGNTISVEVNAGVAEYNGRPADLVFLRDITERKQAEEELAKSEAKHREIIDHANDAVMVINDMKCVFANKGVRMLGYNVSEFVGLSVQEIMPYESYMSILKRSEQESIGEDVSSLDLIDMIHKDGYSVPVEVSSAIIEYESESSNLIVARDITERVKAEVEILSTKNKLNAIINSATDFYISSADLDGNINSWNQGAELLMGYTEDEVVGNKKLRDMVSDKDVEAGVVDSIINSIKTEGSFKGEIELKRKDGSIFPSSFNANLLNDAEGCIIGILVIMQDITVKKQAELELKRAKHEAEEAALAKSRFLSNMSHEIRTPMNGVIGAADLLSDTEMDEEQRKLLLIIKTSGNALLELINDILDFSKIDDGKMEIENISFNIESLIIEIVSMMNVQIFANNTSLSYNKTREFDTMLIGDPHRLRQVIINLISNAIKFTSEGTVMVEIETEEETEKNIKLTISIRDTGMGITEDKIEKIFMAFSQGDGSITRKFGGTGLGLAISNTLVKLMGAERIYVESEPGKGSRFYFTICFLKGETIIDENEKQKEVKVFATADGTRYNILLAEDQDMNAFIAEAMLSKREYNVTIVENGEQAVGALKENEFDLVLMDIQMPIMSGLEATKMIRNKGNKIPIIAITANATKEDVDECYNAGMNGFVSKPLKEEKLFKEIDKIMNAN